MSSKKAPAKPAKSAAKPAAKPAPKAPAKPVAKAAAKPAPKAPAKPAPKVAAKPVDSGKAPAKRALPAKSGAKPAIGSKFAHLAKPFGKAAPATPDDDDATPAELPHNAPPAGRPSLCLIEIVKDGHFFIARTDTASGAKEYKNTVFEDLLTEMLITLQEQLIDK